MTPNCIYILSNQIFFNMSHSQDTHVRAPKLTQTRVMCNLGELVDLTLRKKKEPMQVRMSERL